MYDKFLKKFVSIKGKTRGLIKFDRKSVSTGVFSSLVFFVALFLLFPMPVSSQIAPEQQGKTASEGDLILDCAQRDPGKSNSKGKGYCDNINDLLKQGILIGRYLLGIAGSLALLAFIYGGIMMMVSFGNQDRFQKGRDALVAATIGLLIAFGAYIIIGFVLEAVGVEQSLRAI
ncbi:MAG: hypothetical protein ABEJ24_00135, partial [Candidatus Magasanikbacteria bacterium]